MLDAGMAVSFPIRSATSSLRADFPVIGANEKACSVVTNLDLDNLTERLQTRFLPIRLRPPDNEAIAAFLARRWSVPIATTRMIAAGATGNVWAAMADLEVWMV